MRRLVAAAALVASTLIASTACIPSQSGKVVATVPVAVDLVECVYTQIDSCITGHVAWPACLASTAAACGTDAASVVSIWASKRAAEAREGVADGGVRYP